MTVEVLDRVRFPLVMPLFGMYQSFYGVPHSVEKNRVFFSRFLDCHEAGIVFVALCGQKVIGFATLYFPMSSLSAARGCVLNDLFILEKYRGKGMAKMLIGHCSTYARLRGFEKLEWQTHQSNRQAQNLYEQLPVTRTEWFNYEMDLSSSAYCN